MYAVKCLDWKNFSFFSFSFQCVHKGDGRSKKCDRRWRGSLSAFRRVHCTMKNNPMKFHELSGYIESSAVRIDQSC